MALHEITGRRGLGAGLALCTAFLWGFLPIGLKLLLRDLDPNTVTWFRFTLAGLVLLPFRGRECLQFLRTGGALRWLLLPAVLGLSGNYAFYLFGLNTISPSAAQVLVQLAPLLMALGGLVVFRETFSLRQWAGVGLFTIGLGLFFLPAFAGRWPELQAGTAGLSWIVVAAISWAGYALCQKQLLQALSSQGVLLLVYIGCAAVFACWAAPAGILPLRGVALGLLLWSALNTLIAYGCFSEALRHLEASRVSMVLGTAPLFTMVFVQAGTYWWPDSIAADRPGPLAWSGAVFVVGGSILSQLRESRKKVKQTG